MPSTPFAQFAEVATAVAATSSKNAKRDALAAYLAGLDVDDLGPVVSWLAGSAVEGVGERLGLGWAQATAALSSASGASPDAMRAAWLRHSDFGDAAAELLAGRPSSGLTVGEVATAFAAMSATRTVDERVRLMTDLLARASADEARYIAKVASGEMRIGLREGLLEEAVAAAFDAPLDAVRRALMLTGGASETARLARDGRLGEAALHPGRPIRFMLATPAADADEIIRRVGTEAWVEDKYDGIRAQLHRVGGAVRLFSRDLKDITGAFPEIVAATTSGPDIVLDGELVPYRAGQVMDFAALQTRLGRVRPSAELIERVPVVLVAFDLLHHAGHDTLEAPLNERRAALEALAFPEATAGLVLYSHLARAGSAAEIEVLFDDARARHNEGLMVKDPASVYQPGRRGLGWLKLKKALATLDCVVVGVEWGHGKRRGVLSDYTFAVRTDDDRLLTIGKAYTGLTDAEIAAMTEHFQGITVEDFGRYRSVAPEVVVEVAFDRIMRSGRHESGFALRFPRIVRIRDDKTVADIDSLATVDLLFAAQASGRILLATGSHGETARIAATGEVPGE
jgi:DNA ligase-1